MCQGGCVGCDSSSAHLLTVPVLQYHQDLHCMEGTHKVLLKEILNWVASTSVKQGLVYCNTYWIYGLPGIGKTSLAHSICANLHNQDQLAGVYFCWRDNPELSKPRNILPTLIHKLAIIFPPFRTIVMEHLHKDPNITPESMKHTLFVNFIHKLSCLPEKTLVLVIDTLDECGSTQSHPSILRSLTLMATHILWLRIIITSRPEGDIQHFFNGLTLATHLQYDMTTDKEATSNLQIFAKH